MVGTRTHRRRRVVALTVVAALTVLAACYRVPPWSRGHGGPPAAEVLTSTADGAARLVGSRAPLHRRARPAAVTVATDRTRQRLFGVGAALTESSAHLIAGLPAPARRDLLARLFDSRGGGLGVLRVVIGASDFSSVHASLDDSPVPDPNLDHSSIERDRAEIIPVLHEILAIAPQLEIVASPWSAPGWMKDSGNSLFGTLRPEFEPAYADYLVRFVQAYRAEGIPIGWLTVQNEPAAIQVTYPSMLMSPEQQARLLRDHLGPALGRAGLATRVLVWDHNWCDARPPGGCVGTGPATFPFDVLAATGAAPPIAGTAFHCYGGDQAAAYEAVHAAWPAQQIWQSECSGGTWQGTRAEAFGATARLVLDGWNHWASAELLWNLALDPDHGPHLGGCDTCRGVVTVDPASRRWTPEPDFDVLATFAWAGANGSSALETSVDPATGLSATGVCDPSGRAGAIVWNPGPARSIDVDFGRAAVSVVLREQSLTAVRVRVPGRCGDPGRVDPGGPHRP